MDGTYNGKILTLTLTGSSHGESVGAHLTGLPAGIPVNGEGIREIMKRRSTASSDLVSGRKEDDAVTFESGITDGKTNGDPLVLTIKNRDARPADYDTSVPRPSHADYTEWVKNGRFESGGGRHSGRMTAPLCAAGAILLDYLRGRGIEINARLYSVGGVTDPDAMASRIREARDAGDSVGGVVECTVTAPAGIGGELWDGIDGAIARAVFGIPGVKGIEFGSGFAGAALSGSENNDPFVLRDGKIITEKNGHGGVLGGITSGMPIVFRTAFKPTASIALPQRSVNLDTMTETEITVRGRHDPCIALRAVPCVEAAAALAIADEILTQK